MIARVEAVHDHEHRRGASRAQSVVAEADRRDRPELRQRDEDDLIGRQSRDDVERISIDAINTAYDRMLKSDVRYRFVIDLATLPAA